MSHKTVLRVVQKLGGNHDQPVLKWRAALEGSKRPSQTVPDTAQSISSDEDSNGSILMDTDD